MGRPNKSLGSTKTCSVCHTEKDIDCFSIRRRVLKSGIAIHRKSQCKQCMAEARKLWGKENPEKIRANNSRPNKKASDASRRATAVSATLLKGDEWNDFVIEEMYELRLIRTEETSISWHVDHIVPLNGRKVKGFHVWYNLQVIPACINLSKNNSFEDIVCSTWKHVAGEIPGMA